eukprot:3108555-Prymnesium_polylepis.1
MNSEGECEEEPDTGTDELPGAMSSCRATAGRSKLESKERSSTQIAKAVKEPGTNGREDDISHEEMPLPPPTVTDAPARSSSEPHRTAAHPCADTDHTPLASCDAATDMFCTPSHVSPNGRFHVADCAATSSTRSPSVHAPDTSTDSGGAHVALPTDSSNDASTLSAHV